MASLTETKSGQHDAHPRSADGDITRVFVVGAPRSGTTLLQSVLAAHPDVWSLPETHFFTRLVPLKRLPRIMGLASNRARRVVQDIADKGSVTLPQPFWLRGLSQGALVREFVRVLDSCVESEGKKVWVEKTPRHVEKIDTIDRFISGVRYIHIVRDGRDVVASFYEIKRKYSRLGGSMSVEECVALWNLCVQFTYAHLNEPNHCVVSYDRLTTDPASEAERLCGFVGIHSCEEMIQDYSNLHTAIVRPEEQWSENIKRPIAPRRLEKFTTVLDSGQQEFVEKNLLKSVYDAVIDASQ